MSPGTMTLREIERALFSAGPPSSAFLSACESDARAGVRRLAKRFSREAAESARLEALYAYEYAARAEGARCVAGVDEAGRGPLAGPVVAAAVILPIGCRLPGLDDSKKVAPKKREALYGAILDSAIAVKAAVVDAAVIDRVNIYQATINGMYEAVLSLDPRPDRVLIDAVPLSRLPMASLSIVRGDAKSASIAAASIVAKVTRDRLMTEYDAAYPGYGFAQHKGYGTALHMEALRRLGACPIHRRSFAPVRAVTGGR